MGVLSSNNVESRRKCLFLTEDFKGFITTLPLKRKLIVLEQNGKAVMGWPYDSRLLTPLKLKDKSGKEKDFGVVYPISARNAIFDPANLTGEEYVGANLVKALRAEALEEFHYARDKKALTTMERMAIPLSIAAGIMAVVLTLAAVGVFYRGRI